MTVEFTTFVPVTFARRGIRRLAVTTSPEPDRTFVDGLARGFYWRDLLERGVQCSGAEIARAEGLHHSVVNELLRLTLLAPDLIERALAGRQPRRLTLMWFQRHPLPVDWDAQRQIFAAFEREEPCPEATR